MKNPYEWLASAINNHTWTVAGVAAAVFILALLGLSMVSMETGEDTYLDKTTPRGALLDHYMETYGSDAIMLLYEADNVRDPEILRYIDNLQEDLRGERYVESVSGVVDALKQANGGILPSSKAEIDAIIAQVPAETVEQMMPSGLMTIGVINLEPGVGLDTQKQVLGNIRSTIAISNPPPGLTVTVTGNPAFAQDMMEDMGTETGTLILVAMVLMVVAVGLLFSHVRYSLLPVAIVAIGLISTFGLMGLFGIPISMVVVGSFPVLIGIGIDYGVQFHARFDDEVRQKTIPEAVWATVTQMGPSVLIAMSATALGFIAMFFAPVPMVADFGIVCTIGIASCYIAALVIVPIFAIVTRYQPKNGKPTTGDATSQPSKGALMERYDRFLGRLAYTVAKHPLPVIMLFAVVAAGGFYLDQSVPVSADEKTFVPDDMPALLSLEKLIRVMGSTTTIPVVVSADDVLSPDTLAWIDRFGIYEQEHNDKITGVTSVATLVRDYNGGVLPSTEREVDTVVARIPESTLSRYLNGNMEAVLEFSTVEMEMSVARDLVKRMQDDVAWSNPPAGVTVKITGSLEMFAAVMDDISESRVYMTVIGFAFILIFLILVYTIGVASEYTVLIMERCEEELARGMPFLEAIQTAVQKIGTAITVSGLTTVFGFAALIVSNFNIISNFGIVTVLSVAFSLLGAIVVMPAILALMYRFTGRSRTPSRIAAPD